MAALAGQGGDGERRVAVVGGGIAGLFCASTLARFGYSVTVFDMGKSAPGGRMTTRRTSWRDLSFDHGCQFIRAASPEFRAAVEAWVDAGVAAPWAGRVGELCAATGKFTPREELAAAAGGGAGGQAAGGFAGVLGPGPLYVGVPGMDAVCRHLAEGSGIDSVRNDIQVKRALYDPEDGGRWLLEGRVRQPLRTAAERKQEAPFTPWNLGVFDALVLADRMAGCPGTPGHIELSGSRAAAKMAADMQAVGSQPCLALMCGFEGGAAPLLPFDAASVSGGDVAWVCLDSAKPGRARADGLQCLVSLASPGLSAALAPRLPDGSLPPQTPEMLAALAPRLFEATERALAAAGVALPRPAFIQAHRWGSAFPAQPLGSTCLRADGARLAACGDFCGGGGVEGAALSGRAAADAIRQLFES